MPVLAVADGGAARLTCAALVRAHSANPSNANFKFFTILSMSDRPGG
jgi:hypothetical protein